MTRIPTPGDLIHKPTQVSRALDRLKSCGATCELAYLVAGTIAVSLTLREDCEPTLTTGSRPLSPKDASALGSFLAGMAARLG